MHYNSTHTHIATTNMHLYNWVVYRLHVTAIALHFYTDDNYLYVL